MQVLSNSLLNQRVMSLRTGSQVATITRAIINPNNLKIEGFYVQDSVDKKLELILLNQDIRDILPAGIVVNDHSVLAEAHDLIRLQDVLKINFDIFGKQVVTENKKKLGKVSDFSVEIPSLYIQKIYAAQSVVRTLTGGNMGIDRNQIVEITNRKIIIQDPLKPVRASLPAPAVAN